MINWLRVFQLEKFSFILGFFAATLLWFIFSKAKKWLPEIKTSLTNFQIKFNKSQNFGLLIAIKKDTIRRAQSNHIGSKLFSLDEIVIEPLVFLTDQRQILHDSGIFDIDISETIPNVPELPQINRNYIFPKIRITELIQTENNIIISGIPGSGKSTCLAYLASKLAENSNLCGNQGGKTPFYFHILETDILNHPDITIYEAIYKVFSQYVPNIHLPKLAKFIHDEINSNNAIIMIDGIDELYKEEAEKVFEFILRTSKTRQLLKFVITTSPYFIGNLAHENFLSVEISPFSNKNVNDLNAKWISHWYKNIISNNKNLPLIIKEKLLVNWTKLDLPNYTPLEYTLFIWGALTGDLQGYDTLSIYQSHFLRIFQNNFQPEILGEIACRFINEKKSIINSKGFDSNLINRLLDWGIIQKYNDSFYFNHLDFLGYTANLNAKCLPLGKSISKLSRNPIDFTYASFLSSQENGFGWIEEVIYEDQTAINFNLLLIIPWLRHTTKKTIWRITLFKMIMRYLSISSIPLSIKYRYISAFMFSNDNSFGIILKQLLTNNDINLKKLALMSMGFFTSSQPLLQDGINELSGYSNDLMKYLVLVLSTNSDEVNLDSLARLLLSADENIRKLISQCLANMNEQANDVLKDAITMDDILVRRSAIYGLVHLNDIWVYDILKKLTVEDSQWVIRDMANQAFEYINTPKVILPKIKNNLHELNWIIQFAANKNIGISPDSDPTQILSSLLITGNEMEKRKTLSIIPDYFDYSIYPLILNLVFSENLQLSNEAIVSIWRIFQSGYDFPSTYSEQV